MQITFAGTIIATEPLQGGTDGILGFMLPKGKQNVQWAEYLRAADAVPLWRGNRKRSMSGTIIPAAQDTYADAMAARMKVYEKLPSTGILVIQEGATVITFNQAVLEDFSEVEDVTTGVSYGFTLVFQVGPPDIVTTASSALQDSTAADVTDSTGSPIVTS